MNNRWSFITILLLFHLFCYLSNLKKKFLSKDIDIKLSASTTQIEDNNSIQNSLILKSFLPIILKEQKTQEININNDKLNFTSQYIMNNSNNSKSEYLLINQKIKNTNKAEQLNLKLIEINKNYFSVFSVGKENNKLKINKCWNNFKEKFTKNLSIQNIDISNDRKYLVLVYMNEDEKEKDGEISGNKNTYHYIIHYYENISICKRNAKSHDTIIVNTTNIISSIAVKKNMIIYSLALSKNKFFVLSKNKKNKWININSINDFTKLNYKANFYSTSLKFVNDFSFIQTSIESNISGVFQNCYLYNINKSQYTQQNLFMYKEKNIQIIDNEYMKRKIFSNGYNLHNYLFEFTKGIIVNIDNQGNHNYILKYKDEINKQLYKIKRISSNENSENIIISYEEDNSLYLLRKIKSNKECDYYSNLQKINFRNLNTSSLLIKNFLVIKNEVYILFNNGNLYNFRIKEWYDNNAFISLMQIFIFFIVVFISFISFYQNQIDINEDEDNYFYDTSAINDNSNQSNHNNRTNSRSTSNNRHRRRC